jgi:hypothetical protein
VEGQKLNIIYSLVNFFQFHNCIFLNQFEKWKPWNGLVVCKCYSSSFPSTLIFIFY